MDMDLFDARLKDLERRVHILEDRHEDIVRVATANPDAVAAMDEPCSVPDGPPFFSQSPKAAKPHGKSIENDLGMEAPKKK